MPDGLSAPIQQEATLLAAIMVTEGGYDRVAAKLRAEHFSEPLFGDMFDLMGRMARDGEVINAFSVSRAMAPVEAFQLLGGVAFWLKATESPYLPAAFAYTDEIIGQARRRRIVGALAACQDGLADDSGKVDEVLAGLEQQLSVIDGQKPSSNQRFDRAFADALHRIERLRSKKDDPGVLVHDWRDWNDLTDGMQPGQYILIGGRPSMGKTALSLGVARRAAQAGRGVLYISREMDTPQLMTRMLADLMLEYGGRATFDDIKHGTVQDQDLQRLYRIQRETESWPLVIEDPESLSAGQISPLIRRQKQAFARRGDTLDLVIIDYLGLIDPPPGVPNREQEVSAISRTIKAAAKANGVPIIVLSQLSRSLESREDKRPQLSDLRDSGSLEQDADLVIFVYRQEYYLQRSEPDQFDTAKREKWEAEMMSARDRVDIYTAKNRQGELRRRKGFFFGARQAIRNSDYFSAGGAM